eukprot:1186106-Prorocentrum_minimum.AAC.3
MRPRLASMVAAEVQCHLDLREPSTEFITTCFQHSVQIILAGENQHAVACNTFANAAGDPVNKDFPALGDAAPSEGRPAGGKEGGHPLQLYWEYMVYLFRRMEEINEQQMCVLSVLLQFTVLYCRSTLEGLRVEAQGCLPLTV